MSPCNPRLLMMGSNCRNADHGVSRNQLGQCCFIEAFGALRAQWQHHISNLSRGIPDFNVSGLWQVKPISVSTLRGSRTILERYPGVLVPAWGQAKNRPGITRTQGANDNVVNRFGARLNDQLVDLAALKTIFCNDGCRVFQQSRLKTLVYPCASDQFSAVHRADLFGKSGQDRIDGGAGQ